jgi:BRCT domain type II-containing protein
MASPHIKNSNNTSTKKATSHTTSASSHTTSACRASTSSSPIKRTILQDCNLLYEPIYQQLNDATILFEPWSANTEYGNAVTSTEEENNGDDDDVEEEYLEFT